MRLPVLAVLALLVVPALPPATSNGGLDPRDWIAGGPEAGAVGLYGAPVTMDALDAPEPSAFPFVRAFRVAAADESVPILRAMLHDGTLSRSYDGTFGVSTWVADRGLVFATPAHAIPAARVIAAVANADVLPERQVVVPADASWLGVVPGATSAGVGASGPVVTLDTWSATGGVHARWTIAFGLLKVERVEVVVLADAVGPFKDAWGKRILPVGGHVVVDPTAATRTGTLAGVPIDFPGTPLPLFQLSSIQNGDGTEWRLYLAGAPHIEGVDRAEADMFLQAARTSYTKMIGRTDGCEGAQQNDTWGLVLNETDCVLEIILYAAHGVPCRVGCAPDGRDDDAVRIGIAAGWYTEVKTKSPSESRYVGVSKADVALSVVAHELMHYVQYAIDTEDYFSALLSPSSWVSQIAVGESTARLTQTLVAPQAEEVQSSMWFIDVRRQQGTSGIHLCWTGNDYPVFQVAPAYAARGIASLTDMFAAANQARRATSDCHTVVTRALAAAYGLPQTAAGAEEALNRSADPLVFGETIAWAAPGEPAREWSMHHRATWGWDIPAEGYREVSVQTLDWERVTIDRAGPVEVWCTGGGYARVRTASSGPHDLACTGERVGLPDGAGAVARLVNPGTGTRTVTVGVEPL